MKLSMVIVYVIAAIVVGSEIKIKGKVRKRFSSHRRHRAALPPCSFNETLIDDEWSLMEAIGKSKYIFTGKVLNVKRFKAVDSRGKSNLYRVYLRRVLKGSPSDLRVFVKEGEEESLSGFSLAVERPGAQESCAPGPRPRLSAIFLSSGERSDSQRGPNPRLKLLTDPVPLTLYHLDRINAAVKESTSSIHLPPDPEETETMLVEPLEENVDHTECDIDNTQPTVEPDLVQEDNTINEEILSALGELEKIEKGPTAHEEIMNRWNPIISKGLNKDTRTELLKKHIPFENINMTPPKLNPELAAAVSESARKRDLIISARQKQVGAALAALGTTLEFCLKDGNKIDIARNVNDAAKILCDTIHMDTKSRRVLISSAINKDMKDCLTEEADSLLFGQNLTEKIKTTKAVQRSVKDLKNTVSYPTSVLPNKAQKNSKTLNWKGPRPNTRYTTGRRPNQPVVKPKVKEDKKKQPFRNNANNYHRR